MADISGLLETLDSVRETLPTIDSFVGSPARQALVESCSKLMAAVETPMETVFRLMMAPHTITCIRVAIEMKLFDAIHTAGKSSATLHKLAEHTQADPSLIVRIMRVLTASGVIIEVAENEYASNAVSDLLVNASPFRDAVSFIFDDHTRTLVTLPRYLRETKFSNPKELTDAPFQHAFSTKLPFFDWLHQNPEHTSVVNSAMTIQRAGRGENWFNFFPIESTICKDFPLDDKEAVLLVDIGGGRGHDLEAFRARYPKLPGRLVLEDLPQVIDSIGDLPGDIESLKCDFFAPQPIKGARAYYLHTVLHDWPDSYCVKILMNIALAMSSDSRLLINEWVFTETRTPLFAAQLDISMMIMHGSMERTRAQWQNVLKEAGLEIVDVHAPHGTASGQESLIEARKQITS